ncbi:MAG TPA: helix-turn-helix domain-containing protein, partial [Mycobacterium sp.]|nr:helix-turn-helix domain-containing protein [Mycobacterium sp.]
MRAVDLVVAGASAAEVAETPGLHRGSVYRWWARFERGGRDVLKAKPVPGRPATLSDHQLARLRDILAHKDDPRLKACLTLTSSARLTRGNCPIRASPTTSTRHAMRVSGIFADHDVSA